MPLTSHLVKFNHLLATDRRAAVYTEGGGGGAINLSGSTKAFCSLEWKLASAHERGKK